MQFDGDRAELQLIKNELRALNFAPNTSESCFPEASFTLVSNRSSDSINRKIP